MAGDIVSVSAFVNQLFYINETCHTNTCFSCFRLRENQSKIKKNQGLPHLASEPLTWLWRISQRFSHQSVDLLITTSTILAPLIVYPNLLLIGFDF